VLQRSIPVIPILLALWLGLWFTQGEPDVLAADLPVGEWETIANGDDILDLVWQDGIIWAGTRAGGLLRWDSTDGSYSQYLAPQHPLASNTIRDLALDAGGRLWMATNRGLSVLDDAGTAAKDDDVWQTYTRENTAGGLPSDDLHALAIDGPVIWVGGAQVQDRASGAWRDGGLGHLDTQGTEDPDDDQWSEVVTYRDTLIGAPDGSERLGLVSDNINALALSKNGQLWVATSPHWVLAPAADPDDPPQWQRVHGGISFLDTKGTPSDVSDDRWTANSCQDAQVTITCGVQALAIDSRDYGWAAIQGRGLLFFDAAQPRIPDSIDRRYELPYREVGDAVEAISVGPAGDPALENTVWIGRAKGGLSVLNHRGTPTIRRDDIWDFDRGAPFGRADGLAGDRVQAVLLAGGKAWVGSGAENGVAGGIGQIGLFDLTVGPALLSKSGPPTNFIADIDFGAVDSIWQGHVWIATGSRTQPLFGGGAVDLDTAGTPRLDDDVWKVHTMASTDADGRAPWTGLATNNLHAVHLQGDRVWLGGLETLWNSSTRSYENGGLSVFDGEFWTLRSIENTGGAKVGLRDGSITDIAEGCNGAIWVGTGNRSEGWGAGVDVLTPGASVHQRSQDAWQAFSFPQLASNNTSAIDVDCDQGLAWVASAHHVTLPDSMGSPGGRLIGGGVARYDIAADRWSKSDSRQGLESFASGTIYAEAMSVLAAEQGKAWVGTYGSRAMSQADLVRKSPYWPAPISLGKEQSWSHRIFDDGGMVRSIARDKQGRVWVGTSRGGAARDSATPDSWREDQHLPGIHIFSTPDPASEPFSMGPDDSSVVASDISVIAMAPSGDVWVGTEGFGILRYRPDGIPRTATPSVAPPRTPTPRPPTVTPTVATVEATPTLVRRTPTRVTPGRIELAIPILMQRW
jgi:ligand-binding sensor domain-containing protein